MQTRADVGDQWFQKRPRICGPIKVGAAIQPSVVVCEDSLSVAFLQQLLESASKSCLQNKAELQRTRKGYDPGSPKSDEPPSGYRQKTNRSLMLCHNVYAVHLTSSCHKGILSSHIRSAEEDGLAMSLKYQDLTFQLRKVTMGASLPLHTDWRVNTAEKPSPSQRQSTVKLKPVWEIYFKD
ncbi:hypothetical protein E5288_WYG012409 [Bos mutus]|uniref:Uncharacterized protein n=1 Tax=Bos mutus TaxID=72004 RepID=A0A6B0RQ26_9CETA|nr:hypothetical protein [Bos mutus]